MKNKSTALILSILLGTLGIDRFYLGYTGMGILKLLTCGCFGILWIIDIVRIATGELLPADSYAYADSVAGRPASVTASSSVYDDLKKLSDLHTQGVLTDAEYSKMKADLLRKM